MTGKLRKNVLAGAALILAASLALLLSDFGGRARGATAATPAKRWKIYLIQYNNVLDVQESEEGVLEGLRTSGFVEGRDYEARTLNAQGDMATVSSLIDSAVTDRADLLITFSTPTLQAALRRAPGSLPIVFTYVASAVAAGAGRSEQDHLPNVTGVSTGAAYAEMLDAIRQWFPSVRRVGTLYVPAEANMVFHKNNLEAAARKAGFAVEVVPVSSATDIADAAIALAGRNVDAICQVPGNMTAAGFASIVRAAQRARIPVFAFQQVQAKDGALMVVARDYRDAGREAAQVAVGIMRGDDPAKVPFRNFNRTKFIVNLDVARNLSVPLPAGLLDAAQEVIESGNSRPSRR